MIPKKIYYCWFGRNKKNELIEKCILSRKKYCPTYEIIEINEDNFDINQNNFCKKAYKEKKRAFVSDYARLKTIYDNGGIYMDTDMELIKNIDLFLDHNFFICRESDVTISFGILGSEKGNIYIKSMLSVYNTQESYKTIPSIGTKVYNDLDLIDKKDMLILDKEYFYPFDFNTRFKKSCIKKNTYGIHRWEVSWYPWYYKFLKSAHLLGIVSFLGKLKLKLGNSE